MSIQIRQPPTQEAEDLKAVLASAFRGKPLDPEIAKRVHERAEKVRGELRAKGLTNVAVDLIRECRDE